MNNKEIIESIQKESVAPGINRSRAVGSMDLVRTYFNKESSYLMEFIQNSEDARSSKLSIKLENDILEIKNNGSVFTKKDIYSICNIGKSSKIPSNYIGYLGVGFKSIFLISDFVEIYSGEYRFKFCKDYWKEEEIPWEGTPIWIETNNSIEEDYTTLFRIKIKDLTFLDRFLEEIKSDNLNGRLLLFLNNLNFIELTDLNNNIARKIEKVDNISSQDYDSCKINEYINNELKEENNWIIIKKTCLVPTEVKEEDLVKRFRRDKVVSREIITAFKIENEDIVKEKLGSAYIGVFSFLPLKEYSGLNFLIQADYITNPGRSEILRESKWNIWLSKEIFSLITEKCIPILLKNNKWKMKLTDILFPKNEEGHSLFVDYIQKPLRKYIDETPLLIDIDGNLSNAEGLVPIKREEIINFITKEDFKTIYPDKKLIHPECVSYFDIDKYYGFNQFVRSEEFMKLLDLKSLTKDIEWFKRLYKHYVDTYIVYYFQYMGKKNVKHDEFWNRLQNLEQPIILTEDYKLSKISESYSNPRKLEIPPELQNVINIVHPDLVSSEEFSEFQYKLNDYRKYQSNQNKVLKELSKDIIRQLLNENKIRIIDESAWNVMTDTEKIETIKTLKRRWENGYLDADRYNFITLKTVSGKWETPKDILFSSKYLPTDHDLEKINSDIGIGIPLEFLSNEFIDNLDSDDDLRSWREFFKELGVDKKILDLKKKIIQRIGINMAMIYEKKNNREPIELTSSLELGGYDIDSYDDVEEYNGAILSKGQKNSRRIEVKSSNSIDPEIRLSIKQVKTLMRKDQDYYVYVIKDALRYPTLSNLKGEELSKIIDKLDIRVNVPFKQWANSEAKIDEFSLF